MNWDEVKNFPAYICTTKNSARIESSLKELQKVGIQNINIMYGADCTNQNELNELKLELEQFNFSDKIKIKFRTYGELALGIAFIKSLRSFLLSNQTHMLWFEDDVIAHHYFDSLVLKTKQFVTWKDYNINFLGSAVINGKQKIIQKINENCIWTDVTKEVIWGLHAAVIDKNGATALLNSLDLFQPIDMFVTRVMNANRIKGASLLFPLALCESTTSTNDWNIIYESDKPYNTELQKVWGKYKRGFGVNNTCWGLFFQKNTPSILLNSNQKTISSNLQN